MNPITPTTARPLTRATLILLPRFPPAYALHRAFATSHPLQLKEIFSIHDTPQIKTTKASWPHPPYDLKTAHAIQVAHREPQDFSDRVALAMMRLFRWGMDFATRYKHPHSPSTKAVQEVKEGLGASSGQALKPVNDTGMDERKWLIRMVFLESVAGVPGMVAGMLRHLRSMRYLQRDNGWIETLLEEAYNERMHLLVFLKLAEPGLFMKTMVIGAQGVFFNLFFISYLLSPRTAHRFVGYLEEEAVLTYTRILNDLEAGKLPKWKDLAAPDIAVQYWNMPEGKRDMTSLITLIRADEAKHREVNHTLANLNQAEDPNPFASEYKDDGKPHPDKGVAQKSIGWEREDVI